MVKHKREYVENDAADQSAEVEIEGGEGEGDDDNSSSQDVSEDIESESSQSSESEEDSSEEEEDEDPEDNTVNVTMAFRDPTEADFHGLKALLQTYLDGAPYSCSELVDTIIKQNTVGTVVKSVGDDDEDVGGDPLAVISVLNTHRYKDLKCLAEIKSYLLSHCESAVCKSAMNAAWNHKRTGLIVSERLINCPPQLAPPLLQALFNEIQWATEDEPPQFRDGFKFECYIIVSRVYIDREPISVDPVDKKQKKQEAAKPVIVYSRIDDEFFHSQCLTSFQFPTGREVGQDDLEPYRLVMLLNRSRVREARQQLDRAVEALGTTL